DFNSTMVEMRQILLWTMFFWHGASEAQVVLQSDVAVSLSATPSIAAPGQPIHITVTVQNLGPSVLTHFPVSSSNIYPDQLGVDLSQEDCKDFYTSVTDGATSFWYNEVWTPTDTTPSMRGNFPLAVGESRSCHFNISLLLTAPSQLSFDFHLASF